MKEKLYTIVYFRDGEYFMLSSNCFSTRKQAEGVAQGFCSGRIGDGSKWTYDIEELEYHA